MKRWTSFEQSAKIEMELMSSDRLLKPSKGRIRESGVSQLLHVVKGRLDKCWATPTAEPTSARFVIGGVKYDRTKDCRSENLNRQRS
jgi:hypothetical protein